MSRNDKEIMQKNGKMTIIPSNRKVTFMSLLRRTSFILLGNSSASLDDRRIRIRRSVHRYVLSTSDAMPTTTEECLHSCVMFRHYRKIQECIIKPA